MSGVAVITGGASGLGRALGKLFSEQGARVALLDISEDAGIAAAVEIGGHFFSCDVTRRDSWAAASEQITSKLGAPTHLALNAGVMTRPPSAPLQDDIFDWIAKGGYEKVMRVNVDGAVYGLEALVPHMGKGAAITVTSSAAGISPLSFDPFYAASKHAVIGLVRSLEAPLSARGTRINAFCPGGIATAITPEQIKTPETASRMMSPEEAARALMQTFIQPGSGQIYAKLLPGVEMIRYEPTAIDLNLSRTAEA